MSFREEAFKKEAAEWNKAIEISTSTAAEKAKLHDKIVKELKNSLLEAIEKTKKELYEIIAEHSGQPVERIYADGDRDFWLTSQEALEYGMIDEILRKKK